jgi:alkylation response protein AidB-like acyl-CoA dehydrogenase
MRFLPDEREVALRDEFRTFFEQHCPPEYAARCDSDAEFPSELFRIAGERGMFGLTVPTEYGGRGDDAVALAILFEEAGRAFPDFANLVVRQALCSSAIVRSGPEASRSPASFASPATKCSRPAATLAMRCSCSGGFPAPRAGRA